MEVGAGGVDSESLDLRVIEVNSYEAHTAGGSLQQSLLWRTDKTSAHLSSECLIAKPPLCNGANQLVTAKVNVF